MGKKEAYLEKREAQLRELEAEIEKLRANADKAKADAKIKYYEMIEDLQTRGTATDRSLAIFATPVRMPGRVSRSASKELGKN